MDVFDDGRSESGMRTKDQKTGNRYNTRIVSKFDGSNVAVYLSQQFSATEDSDSTVRGNQGIC